MSNVITLAAPKWRAAYLARTSSATERLANTFSNERRGINDVFWLKENAEFLNVVHTSLPETSDVAPAYEAFYETVESRIEFFPQYYRFILSICLDFEDLSGVSEKGERLVDWARQKGLAEAELSDLQRLEALRLFARRRRVRQKRNAALLDRVRRFMALSAQFALPNKKIAYELTHAIFYLSDYGRVDPDLDRGARKSLEFLGLWAFVEQNADLLSEVCVAMRFARMRPPEIWRQWLRRHTDRFSVEPNSMGVAADDYHEFLMCQWARLIVEGAEGIDRLPPMGGATTFKRPKPMCAPLRELSETIYNMASARTANWRDMRPAIVSKVSDGAKDKLALAEASSPRFGEFFSHFARVDLRWEWA
ncbi:DUF6902 family protein [Shimia isoporae]|nr:hypothetical protein [Shimia isoporae]